jgi:hypothetical protein
MRWPLSARETVRIPVEKPRIEADEAHQLFRHVGAVVRIADPVDHQRLAQDVEYRHPRIERAEGS